jgi:hypothetical protein
MQFSKTPTLNPLETTLNTQISTSRTLRILPKILLKVKISEIQNQIALKYQAPAFHKIPLTLIPSSKISIPLKITKIPLLTVQKIPLIILHNPIQSNLKVITSLTN